MIVIGVTGTKGKSSTVIMITRILEEAGFVVGSMNTVFFKIGEKEWPNTKKQGMLGRFQLQKMLRAMVDKKCTHAVIEVTSEGIMQHRQWGIAFDVAAFTNLSPEHIESHGSYEKYRAAKQMIFKQLRTMHRKTIGGEKIKKVIVVNTEDKEAEQFLKFRADSKWLVGSDPTLTSEPKNKFEHQLVANQIEQGPAGTAFSVLGHYIQLAMHGAFMVQNAMLAIGVARSLGVSLSTCEGALEKISGIPGRVEVVKIKSGARVVIDYAHEPKSFEAILSTGKKLAGKHAVISVFGATGGGRDSAKRPVMGKIAALYSDYIVLTTDDPYDDDPGEIMADIAKGIRASKGDWEEGKKMWRMVDRKKAIRHAFTLAASGDVILLLGKGSEQVMAVAGGKHIPWSDRSVVEELGT